MPRDTKSELGRNLVFAAIWVCLFGITLIHRGDPRTALKLAILSASFAPAIFIQMGIQRLTRFRIPLAFEAVTLVFIALGLLYLAVLARTALL